MKQMEIGMRIPMKGGPKFFGLDQVNAALKAGASVVSVHEGAPIIRRGSEDLNDVDLSVTGFSVMVVIDDSGASQPTAKPWWKFW